MPWSSHANFALLAPVSKRQKKTIKTILKKAFAETDFEKLVVRVELWAGIGFTESVIESKDEGEEGHTRRPGAFHLFHDGPEDGDVSAQYEQQDHQQHGDCLSLELGHLTKWSFKSDLQAEIVVKLIEELKAGPLKEYNSDKEYFSEGAKFLHSPQGKIWSRFNPSASGNMVVAVKRIIFFSKQCQVWQEMNFFTNSCTVKGWFLPQKPAPITIRDSSTNKVAAPNQLAINPSSSVDNPSVMAHSTNRAVPPPSFRTLSTPPASNAQQDVALSAASSPTSTASPVKTTPSSASVSEPPTIICSPSVEAAGAVPPAHETALHSELYDPGEGALCVRCWTVHSTKMGGPFVYMWPMGSTTLLNGRDKKGISGWKQRFSASKIIFGTAAIGGVLAVASLTWFLSDVNSQTRRQ
jgi:hypothetical protein